MLKQILTILLLLPSLTFAGDFSDKDLIGDWEWLGNSFTRSNDTNDLMRTGPSIKKFHQDGTFEYIAVRNGKHKKAVKGAWVLRNNVLSITRPDNGTFHNKVVSFKNGILETQEKEMETFSYMKKQ